MCARKRLSLSESAIHEFRALRRRLNDGRRVTSDEDAAAYVEQRGIAMLAPLNVGTVSIPSLSEADVREPWEGYDITDGAWRWKETLPASRACAYGKLLRSRGTFASWKLFRLFYVINRCVPEPVDYADLWDSGLLTRVERTVMDLVANHGPIATDDLRRGVVRTLGCARRSLVGAITSLQSKMLITVCGGSLEGWSMHHWDLVERQVPPGLLDNLPSPAEARVGLLEAVASNSGVCDLASCSSVLGGWSREAVAAAAAALQESGRLVPVTVTTSVTMSDDWHGRFGRFAGGGGPWASADLLAFLGP